MSLEDLDDDEVLALHFSGAALGPELAQWCDGGLVGDTITVPVGSGLATARVGDWILREPSGNFRVMSREDFAIRYASAR